MKGGEPAAPEVEPETGVLASNSLATKTTWHWASIQVGQGNAASPSMPCHQVTQPEVCKHPQSQTSCSSPSTCSLLCPPLGASLSQVTSTFRVHVKTHTDPGQRAHLGSPLTDCHPPPAQTAHSQQYPQAAGGYLSPPWQPHLGGPWHTGGQRTALKSYTTALVLTIRTTEGPGQAQWNSWCLVDLTGQEEGWAGHTHLRRRPATDG
jgi:hypothetical protein